MALQFVVVRGWFFLLLVFKFWLDVIFWVPKTNLHEEVSKYIFYIWDQHFTWRTWPHRHKTFGLPQEISESDNILCLGDILRFKYVLVENTLWLFPRSHTLNSDTCIVFRIFKLYDRGTKIPFANKRLMPLNLGKKGI
jgi:hypothetical protein